MEINRMRFSDIIGMSTLISVILFSVGSDVDAQPVQKSSSQTFPSSEMSSFEGRVEAERQTVIAAQISGAIIELAIKAGDVVKAGQLLIRIDAHAATQSAVAGKSQVIAAQASLDLARKELDRQKQLFNQGYLSQAALDRAEARFKVAEAEAHAQIAQAGSVETQAGFYTIRAPYSGVIAELPVSLGSMAMPGQPLMSLYDPSTMRVTAMVPQSVASHEMSLSQVKLEIPGQTENKTLIPTRLKLMPSVDAGSHTVEIRLELPAKLTNVLPGMFARVWLPAKEQTSQTILIPITALVRRAELNGVYVLDGKNQPLLRQIRIGRLSGGQVEVLSGLGPNEHVVQDAESALMNQTH